MQEFEKINARGGVLGAMERMYQRSKIQEESWVYETKKHDGEIPIIGVNTFVSDKSNLAVDQQPIIRSTKKERSRPTRPRGFARNRTRKPRRNSLHRAISIGTEECSYSTWPK
jgi:methylmalonyl-CoA mutase N-terminal domain/subunit